MRGSFKKSKVNTFNYFLNFYSEDKMVIESKIDPKDWVLECERAASKLKIQIKHDPREWRGHFE